MAEKLDQNEEEKDLFERSPDETDSGPVNEPLEPETNAEGEVLESPLPEVTEEEEQPTVAETMQDDLEDRFNHLLEMLDARQYNDFMHEIEAMNPVDAADFLERLPYERLPAIFRIFKKDISADIFAELDTSVQQRIISAMTDRELANIVDELYVDDTVDMLAELPANIVQRIMKNAKPETRQVINRFLAYPEDSAGSVMTSEFIELRPNMTCGQSLEHIRSTGIDKETIYMTYVTDRTHKLLGTLPLKDLLLASPETSVLDVMTDENIIYAYTGDDQETVANLISKYDLLALPIVDRENRLVGIVTVDDALDVMETEATEDIEKMAAILPTDKPYLKTSVFETWKKRIPWLLLLMVTATFTSTIITNFEEKLAGLSFVVSLSAFIPMLMDTGGNAGGQSSVTIIRALSLHEIEPKRIFRILFKEFRVSILCGLTVAVACFFKVWAVDCKFNTDPQYFKIAAVISVTIFAAIIIAKLVGTLLPLGAKAIKLDPAVMASPFITTIVDTLTLIIYFGVVTAVFSNAL